jgi:hypothetical protein
VGVPDLIGALPNAMFQCLFCLFHFAATFN